MKHKVGFMKHYCPHCRVKVVARFFLFPKSVLHYRCPSCDLKLTFTGPFAWGLDIAYLLLSFAIYDLIKGNHIQALVLLPVALLITMLQYYLAPIKVVGTSA